MASNDNLSNKIIPFEDVIEFVKRNKYLVASVAGGAIGYFALRKYFGGGVATSQARLDGKTVIITGSNTGIGKETARDLAARGARVILACRDLLKAERTAENIKKETENTNVVVKVVDLASLSSIRKFAERINKEEKRCDILINNAGIMCCPKWQTEDGFEMQFGVNHLGHFLLTNLLLDLIKKSTPSRIINVSSLAHAYGKIDFDDLNSDKDYNPWKAYSQSKLANVLFTEELSRRLADSGVTVYSVHPGVVKSELGRHMDFVLPLWRRYLFQPIRHLVFKSSAQGAQTTIHCAVAEEIENSTGKYFADCAVKKQSDEAMDKEKAKKLWEISAKLVKLDDAMT